MEDYLAHVTKDKKRVQTLRRHSYNVKQLCMRAARILKLEHLAALIGLLHDFGKATHSFKKYLLNNTKRCNHSMYGARYAHERWSSGGKTARITAGIIAMCIYGHHAGLPDALNRMGASPFIKGMGACDEELYQEAKQAFVQTVADESTLDALFNAACKEIEEFGTKCAAWKFGMLARLMLSILVDADRWDSACFEYDTDPCESMETEMPPWSDLRQTLERKLSAFRREGELANIRWKVSDACRAAGSGSSGIYSLTVPTGGGKTLSSLRFALTHAEKNGQRRIFYVIPYNTILDQNARDIREALNGYPSILEHHANVVIEDEQEMVNYKALTERWDSDIILTSLVQFMNAFFRKENTDARRMHGLSNSVLIFDEIQSLPRRCKRLFEKAIQYLAKYCNCTVLLCTATQPHFDVEIDIHEIIEAPEKLYNRLKRVCYIYDENTYTCADASLKIAGMVAEGTSTLAVVNTKRVAFDMYQQICAGLHERGMNTVDIKHGISKEELEADAQSADENSVLCVHLSTNMCAAHRKLIIDYIKAWRRAGKRTCCVSTSLIEAGINISFPVVVRSIAGMPSIIQAGGRCNRNCEIECGTVYIWNIVNENLSRLPEIVNGQNLTREIAKEFDNLCGLDVIQRYFKLEAERENPNIQNFPYEEWNDDLVNMLSANDKCKCNAKSFEDSPLEKLSLKLCQSFRTAGTAFNVIDQTTVSVLVPYSDESKKLIERLSGQQEQKERMLDLRKAQQYSVNLYPNMYDKLKENGALTMLEDIGVIVLREGYYDMNAGVMTESSTTELFNIFYLLEH